ncbi:ribonuclease HII [Clostridium punense]|uniref:Ribonuclease HII n=2 Tax=Clostridiaceae TaxID=31979 RepID=A0ABS4JXR4_9CLOT|nr:hypothetical protein M918_20255 [Clostridium sp. BL8]MBP2020319.1 ribonuclease HII [Clostridium punense]
MNNLIVLQNIQNMNSNEIKALIKEFMNSYSVKDHEELYLKVAQTLSEDKRKNVNSMGKSLQKQVESYKSEVLRVESLYNFDKSYGYKLVAGVDEVGRGPLAGPIVSAAVILDLNTVDFILHINDSKKLTPSLREELSQIIKEKALAYSIAVLDNEEIDKRGIGFCNNEVFKLAIDRLKVKPELVLSDGYAIKGFALKNEFVIKGDTKSASIACASILAKVYRDNMMKEYSNAYSEYGFEHNVGYGSKDHVDAIKKYGITKIHRKSFLTKILSNE